MPAVKNLVRTTEGGEESLNPEDLFVGLLADQATGFGPLQALALPNQAGTAVVQLLNAQTMPSLATVLNNFNLIILNSFTTSSLTQAQLQALQTWVNQGGALIEIGGSQWQRTLGSLPADLLPARPNGTGLLPAGTHLLPIGGPMLNSSATFDTLQAPITVSTATVKADAQTILSAGTPLLVQSRLGQGSVCYLAFDPTLEPLVGWPGATTLWKGLLLRALGEQLLPANFGPGPSFGPSYALAKLQHLLLPYVAPSPWFLLLLFLGYLIVLGPLRWFVLRRLKRKAWNWRIALSTIVVFSLLNYAVALYQQGTSLLSNSFSIIQLNQGESFAHSTAYIGIYVPFVSSDSDVQVHLAS